MVMARACATFARPDDEEAVGVADAHHRRARHREDAVVAHARQPQRLSEQDPRAGAAARPRGDLTLGLARLPAAASAGSRRSAGCPVAGAPALLRRGGGLPASAAPTRLAGAAAAAEATPTISTRQKPEMRRRLGVLGRRAMNSPRIRPAAHAHRGRVGLDHRAPLGDDLGDLARLGGADHQAIERRLGFVELAPASRRS